jgi:hypothetical protein
MVTFRPDIPYAVVRQKAERQSRLLTLIMGTTAAASTVGSMGWLYYLISRSQRQ